MARFKYTKEHIEYLREISPGRYNDEITRMFNERFGLDKTVTAIATVRQKNGIKTGVPKAKPEYTKEHIDYIRELCSQDLFLKDVTKKFNERFGLNKTEAAIQNQKSKHGIYTGARNYYQKGTVPWNKGKKGYMGPNKTSFKKGQVPPNRVPIGTERTTVDGYVEVKIQDGKLNDNWQYKNVLIWEQHHGPVPDGHCVIFGDGDRSNFDIDNLILVSRAQLVRLNQLDLIKDDADLTRVGVTIAELKNKMGERRRQD